MLAFALGALGYGKIIFQAIFTWLSKRSLAEIGCIVLVILCLIEFSALHMERRHSRKVEAQLAKCSEVQRRLAVQSKAQQREVTKTIDHYVKVEVPVVKERVRKIETAPLPGNCRTPKEVLDADV